MTLNAAELIEKGKEALPNIRPIEGLIQKNEDQIDNLTRRIKNILMAQFGSFDEFAAINLKKVPHGSLPPLTPPPDAADNLDTLLDTESLESEVKKRRIINQLIQGGGIVAAYTAPYGNDERLRHLVPFYQQSLAAGAADQAMVLENNNVTELVKHLSPAGMVQVEYDANLVAQINVQAVSGHLLLHESAKGLLEIVAQQGLPDAQDTHDTPTMFIDYNEKLRVEILRQADKPEHEHSDLINGIDLWVQHFGDTITPETLFEFQELCVLPPHEFFLAIKKSFANAQEKNAPLDERAQFIHDNILADSNLPQNEEAKTAIIAWFTSRQMKHYIATEMGWDYENNTDFYFDPEFRLALRHLVDFLNGAMSNTTLPRQYALSPQQLKSCDIKTIQKKCAAFDKWTQRTAPLIQVKGDLVENVDFIEQPDIFLEGNMRLVELISPKALRVEGQLMDHCIKNGTYDNKINGQNGYHQFSLLDANGNPHCTFEICNNKLIQCQGKSNKPPGEKYAAQVQAILTQTKWAFDDKDVNRTGLIRDRHGEHYSIFSLPEIFNGNFDLRGVTILESTGKLRVVNGNFNIAQSSICELPNLTEINGDATYCYGISCDHIIRVSGKTIYGEKRETRNAPQPIQP